MTTTIPVKCKCTELSIHLSNSNLISNFNIFPFIGKGSMFCLQDLSFIAKNVILIMKYSFNKYHNHLNVIYYLFLACWLFLRSGPQWLSTHDLAVRYSLLQVAIQLKTQSLAIKPTSMELSGVTDMAVAVCTGMKTLASV